MKVTTALSIVLALPVAGAAYGQTESMQDMRHHSMNMPAPAAAVMTYQATAMVKAVDLAKGRVTLAHDAIKTLNWPAMTMAFSVKDSSLLDKLIVGKQV